MCSRKRSRAWPPTPRSRSTPGRSGIAPPSRRRSRPRAIGSPERVMPIFFDKREHIGIVTLSRPGARNAWGADFNEGLARHFAAMAEDDEVRCAVLTGDAEGGAFSAGANLKDPNTHTVESPAEFIKSVARRRRRAFEVLGEFPKPIVAAVNGYAVGLGCIIPFCCDLVVASERAERPLPPASFGIV